MRTRLVLLPLGVFGFFVSGFVASILFPNPGAQHAQPSTPDSEHAAAVVALATPTPAPTITPTPAPPTMEPWRATSTSAAATSLAAALAANETATVVARWTADANATIVGAWTAEAVADADALRDAEIESVALSNASTAWALTQAPADATANAPSTWEAIAADQHRADINATARQGDANRGELVAWTGAGALALSFVIVAAGIGAIMGAVANRIEWKATTEMKRADADADATRARAGVGAAARNIPVNPNTDDATVLVDVDQWRPRLEAFMRQSILLSPGAGAASTTVTPANNDGWNSRAEWYACVNEMARRGWCVRVPGAGGGTTFAPPGTTAGDILELLTISNLATAPP